MTADAGIASSIVQTSSVANTYQFTVDLSTATSGTITATSNTIKSENVRTAVAEITVCGYDNLDAAIFVEPTDIYFNVLPESFSLTGNSVTVIASQAGKAEC